MNIMKGCLCVAAHVMLLTACGQISSVSEQFQEAQSAVRPSSEEAAERAVVAYFAKAENVPEAAGYSFNPVVNGVVDSPGLSEAGWFMCGNVSTPNPDGRLGRVWPFIAHFDLKTPDHVADGEIERGDFEIVTSWCRSVYGTGYLPLSDAGGPVATIATTPTAPTSTPAPALRPIAVLFAFDSAELGDGARKAIAEVAAQLGQSASSRIIVTGYTDLAGSEQYNNGLSLRRANAVKNELVRLGLGADRIDAVGKGMNDPVVPTPLGVREPSNRRVEYTF
jgi:hypothetical protein